MADGELFAAMHDVGLADFVAKGLDKKHRKPLAPLDVAGMTAREPRRVSPHSIFPRLVRERNNEY